MPLRFACFRRSVLLVAGLCVLAVAGCDTGGSAEVPNTLAARFGATLGFGDLATVLATAGLTERLDGEGEVTVFAPSDDAFDALGDSLVGAVLSPEQRALLQRLLLHHVVPGRLAPEDLADGATLTTLAGTELHVRRLGPVALVDGVALDLTARINAGNGVAYEAQSVLTTALSTRERVALSPALATFRDRSVSTSSYVATEGPLTILAPLDDAFLRLGTLRVPLLNTPTILRRALRAHVLPGDVDVEALPAGSTVTTIDGEVLRVEGEGLTRTVGGIRVLTGQKTSDGRVYVLRDVVLATLTVGEILRVLPITSLYNFDVRRYGEATARLDDPDAAVTVVAPTNQAFNFRQGSVTGALGLNVNAPLARRVTLTHVLNGFLRPAEIVDGQTATALDGTVHTLRRIPGSGSFSILGSQLQGRSYEARNGVIYTTLEYLRPAVDLFDSALLLGLTDYANIVRQVGLEAEFRAVDGTLIAFLNGNSRMVESRPDAATLLRYHATALELAEELINSQDTTYFQTLQGRARYVQQRGGVVLDRRRYVVEIDSAVVDTVDVGQQIQFLSRAFDGGGLIYLWGEPCEIPTTPRPQCPPDNAIFTFPVASPRSSPWAGRAAPQATGMEATSTAGRRASPRPARRPSLFGRR